MSNRKAWMRDLQVYKFSRDGLMTQETARDQRLANERSARCVTLSRNIRDLPEHLQAENLGAKWSQVLAGEGFTTYGNA